MLFMFVGIVLTIIVFKLHISENLKFFFGTLFFSTGILLGLFFPIGYEGKIEVLSIIEIIPIKENVYVIEQNGNYLYKVKEDDDHTMQKTLSKNENVEIITSLESLPQLNYCSKKSTPSIFSFGIIPIKKYFYQFIIPENANTTIAS